MEIKRENIKMECVFHKLLEPEEVDRLFSGRETISLADICDFDTSKMNIATLIKMSVKHWAYNPSSIEYEHQRLVWRVQTLSSLFFFNQRSVYERTIKNNLKEACKQLEEYENGK